MKKFLIISGYYEGESYGLLGPQMAATIIQEFAGFESIVIGVCRDFDKDALKNKIYDFFNNKTTPPIIGFSTLLGREELFLLAKELKEEGAITILAGPQSEVDFIGERAWIKFPNRFKGFWNCFNFALQGPAEQIIPFLLSFDSTPPGSIKKTEKGFVKIPKKKWDNRFLKKVNWNNLYTFYKDCLKKVNVSCAQLLHHIGCPYARRKEKVFIDYPSVIGGSKKICIETMGCSFCDVAVDKGFFGKVSIDCITQQLLNIPDAEDGRKIPFEVINENPIPFLPVLLEISEQKNIKISQINLTLRADWFLKHFDFLKKILKKAKEKEIRILISSIGFEAFDNKILKNLHKGIDVDTNIKCIKKLRSLKEEYPENFFYSREDGAIHGFIHPTPWDDEETRFNTQKRIFVYQLFKDILPFHSTPLVIHHACPLGDWIREIEEREKITFTRKSNIIYWWEAKDV